jgi:hypothetical protein
MPLGEPALLRPTFENNPTLPDLFSEVREYFTLARYTTQTAVRPVH